MKNRSWCRVLSSWEERLVIQRTDLDYEGQIRLRWGIVVVKCHKLMSAKHHDPRCILSVKVKVCVVFCGDRSMGGKHVYKAAMWDSAWQNKVFEIWSFLIWGSSRNSWQERKPLIWWHLSVLDDGFRSLTPCWLQSHICYSTLLHWLLFNSKIQKVCCLLIYWSILSNSICYHKTKSNLSMPALYMRDFLGSHIRHMLLKWNIGIPSAVYFRAFTRLSHQACL